MSIPFRQVHLDFHTSEYIPKVALGSAEVYAETLDKARVKSVTTFARGHHGWLYYPSKKHPELMHPHLENHNLLIEQIDACHARGIRTPIYTTIQWDGRIMREHSEWLARDAQGNPINTMPVKEPHFYHTICFNTAYRAFLFDHVQDIIDVLGAERVDGFFFDILHVTPCCCTQCTKDMQAQGFTGKDGALAYGAKMLDLWKEEMSEFVRTRLPDATIFYNGGHVDPSIRATLDAYSHVEVESLPSGDWGYDHFPVVSRYARTLGKDVIGMTGKFHTFWGDFHSVKNQAALEFECFSMLAQGCGCSIGDQLHPSMGLSPAGYDLIGSVYKQVEQKEPWCIDATSVTEIGVLNLDEWRVGGHEGLSSSLIGAVRMLQELSLQFDVIDTESDFCKFRLIILPDEVPYSEELESQLLSFVEQGGSVLGSGHSMITKEQPSNLFGVQYVGDSPYDREFIQPLPANKGSAQSIGKNLFPEPYVMYHGGVVVKPVAEAKPEVLMKTVLPYFNREGKTFCSHQHSPANPMAEGHPAVIEKGKALYYSHPIFKLYRKNGALWCKEIVKDGIQRLLQNQLVSHNGPSSLITTLQWQEKEQRAVLHLLHYIPEKRTEDLFVIEDVIPLYDITVNLHMPEGAGKIKSLKLVPEGKDIAWNQCSTGMVTCKIPAIHGHQMVEIVYKANQ